MAVAFVCYVVDDLKIQSGVCVFKIDYMCGVCVCVCYLRQMAVCSAAEARLHAWLHQVDMPLS